jgi:hypothetical protein
MPLVPVKIPPGLERNNTPYETLDRYWDANLVRWQSGSIVPIGGWTKLTATPLTGPVRKIYVYRDNIDQRHVLVGTGSKLYEDNGSSYTDITPAALVPLDSVGTAGGYGTLTYGTSTYGTPRPGPSPIFSPFAYWSFDNWGEDVVMTESADGRIFYYSTATATVAPAVVTTAPTGNNAVAVSQERHVIAVGQVGGGGSVFRVAWSSREDYTDWNFASTTNSAGFQDLDTHAPLLAATEVREGHLIHSMSDCYLMQYVGQPFIFGFTWLSTVAMMHPDSIISFNGRAAWLGRNGFQVYSGGGVANLDCPILNDILAEFDPSYGPYRIHGAQNGRFPELWWFYPTRGNTEANRYVIWNYVENWWAWGMLTRSAMSPAVAYTEPFMGNADGDMFEHDEPDQWTNAGQPRFQDIFVETGALGVSDRIVDINQLQAATGDGATALQVTAYAQYTPEGTVTTFGPYTPRSDGYCDTRISGRNVRFRWQPTSDGVWGIGTVRVDIPQQQGSGAKR